MLYIGIDDTDNLESRGTGHLAREIAATLASTLPGCCSLLGVTRHQLLFDRRVPYTKNNSASAIMLSADGEVAIEAVVEQVRELMLAHPNPGSDPGLCVAQQVPDAIAQFGRRVQQEVVIQSEARALAAAHALPLQGLGGDEGGVIGALAAVGLAASGEDGRYVLVGRSRELDGVQPISAVLETGIAAVQTMDGGSVTEGLVQIERLRPARRGGLAVLVVERAGEVWRPLKLD